MTRIGLAALLVGAVVVVAFIVALTVAELLEALKRRRRLVSPTPMPAPIEPVSSPPDPVERARRAREYELELDSAAALLRCARFEVAREARRLVDRLEHADTTLADLRSKLAKGPAPVGGGR